MERMNIKDVVISSNVISNDIRGISSKCVGNKIDFVIDEVFFSKSFANVIRGMHFQPYPYGQKKRIIILKGKIKGVILDLRKESDTFMDIMSFELESNSNNSVFVPQYCAWGFLTLEETEMLYLIDGKYKKEFDFGVRWDSIGYEWGGDGNYILSDRDKKLPGINEILKIL